MSDQSIPQLTWEVHPLRENWMRSALLLLFLLLLFLGIYWLFQSGFVSLLSAIFVTGSLYKYFVPFRFELYEHQLIVTAPFYRLTKPWSGFRSLYVDKNGVLLSHSPSLLGSRISVVSMCGLVRINLKWLTSSRLKFQLEKVC